MDRKLFLLSQDREGKACGSPWTKCRRIRPANVTGASPVLADAWSDQ